MLRIKVIIRAKKKEVYVKENPNDSGSATGTPAANDNSEVAANIDIVPNPAAVTNNRKSIVAKKYILKMLMKLKR